MHLICTLLRNFGNYLFYAGAAREFFPKSCGTSLDTSMLLTQKAQEGCGGLRGENPGALQKARSTFQQPFPCRKCPNLGRDRSLCCRKAVNNFPAATNFGQPQPSRVSDLQTYKNVSRESKVPTFLGMPNFIKHPPGQPPKCTVGTKIIGGKLFYLQLELFCLRLSFFAYSPLRPFLDALSHCKQKSSNCK